MSAHSGNRRRDFVKYIGATALGTSVSGCLDSLGGSNNSSVTLTIGAAGGTSGEWCTKAYWDPFKKETSHDIQHEALRVSQIVNKIQANKKNPVLHVGYLGPSQGTRLYEQGLLVPTEEYVTDDKIPDSFVKPGITASLLSPFGIGYNTDEVDKEITSWEDLLDPAFKGKVGIPAWGWMGNSWIYAVSKALGGSESNLKPGWDFIKKLVNENDAVICPNTDQTNKLFKTGDIVIAPFWSARTDNLTINYDIPTKFVYPEEGTLSFFFGWPIVKGHPEQERKAAEQYVTEYTHDAKRQAVYTNQSGYPYTNPDAKQHVKDEVLEKHPSLDITEANQKSLQALNLNWAKTFENREEVSSKWRRIVKG